MEFMCTVCGCTLSAHYKKLKNEFSLHYLVMDNDVFDFTLEQHTVTVSVYKMDSIVTWVIQCYFHAEVKTPKWFLFYFLNSFNFKCMTSLPFLFFCPFPILSPIPVLYHCRLSHVPLSLMRMHKYSHTSSQDQSSQKKNSVVLLNSNGKTCQGSRGISVTTLCTDDLPASKQAKQRDWLSVLLPSSINSRPSSSLRFSASLNDVGQRVDNLCHGLHFIDRTCSEGELELKPEPAQLPGLDQSVHTLNGKLAAAPTHQNQNPALSTRTHPHLVPSYTNNYKYMLGIPNSSCLQSNPITFIPPPSLSNNQLHPLHSPRANFLRLFLPFSRSSTSTSLHCSELGSYASHLHITKSSSTLLEGSEAGFPPEDIVGDDDVFEEDLPNQAPKGTGQLAKPETISVAGPGTLLAPLCYMDEDSDLDCCPSPLSEKTGPLSPYSLSGDCCRWVIVWMVQSTPTLPMIW
ncbi:uncharacterized protein [Channa argus]|uniref:uncharacterized protein n=1 Tax=Channa argus TaxID=215402 RepID=UPI003520B0DA